MSKGQRSRKTRRGLFEEMDLLEPVSYGAIDTIGASGLFGPLAEIGDLFRDDLLTKAKDRLDTLGLSHFLVGKEIRPLAPRDVYLAIQDAVGAERADAREYDPAANEAWFLIAFVWLHLRAHLDDEELNAPMTQIRLSTLIDLGRLLEWWRWRSEGLDRMAASRKKQVRSLVGDSGGSRTARNAQRRAEREAWEARAQELADDVRTRNPGLSASALALRIQGKLAKEGTPKAHRTVRRALAKRDS